MIRKIIFFIYILFSFNLAFANSGSGISLELMINKDEIHLGEVLSISLEIKQNNSVSIDDLEIKGLDDFKIIGQSTHTSIQVVGGQYFSNKNLSYKLLTTKDGEFILGPAVAKIGTGEVLSNTGKIIIINNNSLLQKNTKNNEVNLVDSKYNGIGKYIYLLLIIPVFIGLVILPIFKFLDEKYKLKDEETNIEKLNIEDILIDLHKALNDKNINLFNNKIEKYFYLKYDLDVRYLTNKEIIYKLEELEKNEDIIKKIKDILKISETIKYSKNNF